MRTWSVHKDRGTAFISLDGESSFWVIPEELGQFIVDACNAAEEERQAEVDLVLDFAYRMDDAARKLADSPEESRLRALTPP